MTANEVFQWFEHFFIEQLKAPKGVIEAIRRDDDWAFTLKLHALIESTLNEVIVLRLGYPALSPIITRLEVSNSTTGKVAFAQSVGLVNDFDKSFIRKFSELRNQLVHNARHLDFDYSHFWKDLDSNGRTAWRMALRFINEKNEEDTALKNETDQSFLRKAVMTRTFILLRSLRVSIKT